MPTYWLHTDKTAQEVIADVYDNADSMENTHYLHFSLKTGGRGKDRLLHPDNRELLHMASCFTVSELDSLALKGGFNNAKDMLYMSTGRPDGMSKGLRGSACDNDKQKEKHNLIMKYMRANTGQSAGTVAEYTTKKVTHRKLHDTPEISQQIALLDWEFNQDSILNEAYQINDILVQGCNQYMYEEHFEIVYDEAVYLNWIVDNKPAPVNAPVTSPAMVSAIA